MGLLLAQTIRSQIKPTESCYLVCWNSLFGLSRSFSASHLAPGASTLLTMLADSSIPGQHSVHISKPVREMDVNDWATLVQAFHSWPFAPDVGLCHSLWSENANILYDIGFAHH